MLVQSHFPGAGESAETNSNGGQRLEKVASNCLRAKKSPSVEGLSSFRFWISVVKLLHIKPATNQKSRDVVADAEIAGNGKAVVKGIHATDMK